MGNLGYKVDEGRFASIVYKGFLKRAFHNCLKNYSFGFVLFQLIDAYDGYMT